MSLQAATSTGTAPDEQWVGSPENARRLAARGGPGPWPRLGPSLAFPFGGGG